jgi:uncharacterized protein YbaR (Trm112 family)
MISKELLDILVCPDDKTKVELVGEEWLVCHPCGRRYPIRDDIPIMLIEEGDKWRIPPEKPKQVAGSR